MTRDFDSIMNDAAAALAENENLRKALRQSDERVAALCREYGDAMRVWGVSPHHLRQATDARTKRGHLLTSLRVA